MNIPKAIEILSDPCWDYIPEHELDIRDAIKLGIKALKRCLAAKEDFHVFSKDLLPGETDENENTH